MRARSLGLTCRVALVLAILSSPVARAVPVCAAPANCITAGGLNTCTEMWMYSIYNATATTATGAATYCNVAFMASISQVTFIARRPTSAAATGACNFAGTFYNGDGTYTCTIDAASGLPVELLDFGLEDEEEATAENASAQSPAEATLQPDR